MYFIGSDKPEDIQKVLDNYPKFEEIYREIVAFRYHPVEAISMFSETLKVLDENTVKYMVEEMKQELEEKEQRLQESQRRLDNSQQELEEKDREIQEKNRKIEELLAKLAGKEER